jgi:hypothetical protein
LRIRSCLEQAGDIEPDIEPHTRERIRIGHIEADYTVIRFGAKK